MIFIDRLIKYIQNRKKCFKRLNLKSQFEKTLINLSKNVYFLWFLLYNIIIKSIKQKLRRANKMKRTQFKTCVGKQNGYDVYRTVLTDGKKFYVRWNKKLVDVTDDQRSFVHKLNGVIK